jgi:hypothetical protein
MGLAVELLLALGLSNDFNIHANKEGKLNNTFTYAEVIDIQTNLFKKFELAFSTSTTLQNLGERVRTIQQRILRHSCNHRYVALGMIPTTFRPMVSKDDWNNLPYCGFEHRSVFSPNKTNVTGFKSPQARLRRS